MKTYTLLLAILYISIGIIHILEAFPHEIDNQLVNKQDLK